MSYIPFKKMKLSHLIDMVDDTQNIWDETSVCDKAKNMVEWKNYVLNEMVDEEKELRKKKEKSLNLQ